MKTDPDNRKTYNSKKLIRKRIQRKRDSLSRTIRHEASISIAAKLAELDLYKDAEEILAYYPFRSEIDTTIILHDALKQKKRIILPKVNKKNLDLYYVKDLSSDLSQGSFDIMEPIPSKCAPASYNNIDLVLIPGVGFDRDLNRLGYGGGFYDKLLEKLPEDLPRISMAFDIQIIESIPVTENDLKVDIIITEKEIIRSNNNTDI